MAAAWAYEVEVGRLGGAVELGVERPVLLDSDTGDWGFWEAGTG